MVRSRILQANGRFTAAPLRISEKSAYKHVPQVHVAMALTDEPVLPPGFQHGHSASMLGVDPRADLVQPLSGSR